MGFLDRLLGRNKTEGGDEQTMGREDVQEQAGMAGERAESAEQAAREQSERIEPPDVQPDRDTSP